MQKQQSYATSTANIATPMIPEHVLSEVGFDSSLPEYNEYCETLSGLIEKPFDVHRFVCWGPLEQVGLNVTVKDTLKQKYYYSPDGKKTYYDMYQDWEDLLHKDMPVFEQLCWEFYSTYFLKEEPEGIKDTEFMRFRLGGRPHQMSLEDFTWCLNIYSEEEMGEQHFNDYIWSGARVFDAMNDFDPNNVWKNFSSSTSWSPHGDVNTLSIDKAEFRLIHMFLTCNIFHRSEDTDRVTLFDLWYLEQIRSKTHVNIPYCVAYYLKHIAANNSRICGGHFVTLIAHHLRLEFDEAACDVAKEVTLPSGFIDHIDHIDYVKANVISEPVQEEPPKEEQLLGEGDSIFEILNRMEELQLQQEQTFRERIKKLKEQREQTVREGFNKLSEKMAEIEKLSKKRIAEFEKLSQINIAKMELQPPRDMENVSEGRQAGKLTGDETRQTLI